jgi:hypothetical protein
LSLGGHYTYLDYYSLPNSLERAYRPRKIEGTDT